MRCQLCYTHLPKFLLSTLFFFFFFFFVIINACEDIHLKYGRMVEFLSFAYEIYFGMVLREGMYKLRKATFKLASLDQTIRFTYTLVLSLDQTNI